ncbi:MAG: hypothetical protein AAB597_02695 [Patescibacteria group bacterium]
MATVCIAKLDKAAVLAALYNASKPQGAGFMHYNPEPMTGEQARQILEKNKSARFDYMAGRVMKIDLSKDDEFDPWGYDRDNGAGAAQRVIDSLRASGNTNNPVIDSTHKGNTTVSAMATKARLGEKSVIGKVHGMPTLTLGLDDMAPHLRPKLDKVLNKS